MEEKIIALTNRTDTEKLGTTIARSIRTPPLIFLSGDLGAGKTTLARALIETLLPTTRVQSPTYAYMQMYRATTPIYHFDLYRIHDCEEIFELGLYEFLDQHDAIRLVEWPQRLPKNYRDPDLHVTLTHESHGRSARLKYFSRVPFIP